MRRHLMEIYDRLYSHFGPRHWWPAETPFEVIAGAILTQNVAWKNVEKAIAALRERGYLGPLALHTAPDEEIEQLIRPAGYFRMKTKKLKAFTRHLFERYGGSLDAMFRRPLGELRQELLGIYGLGPETVDAILCYAGNLPVMVMDAYTRRVFGRLGLTPENATYDQLQAFFHRHLPADVALYNEYHALIDGLANRLCTKRRPACGECPVADLCRRVGVEEGA